ncbi:MAG TPA: hypothetical protein VK172_01080 [Lentimicrobium sp.]|nr:hypothetical protein [Lentimicrobium sp.]
MPFVDEILKYRSLSIVGLEKNTGKTECLNYILRRLEGSGHRLAVTSIGVDGEKTDAVTGTPKPETDLYKSMIFITSEKHFRQKKLTAEILEVSEKSTALGRLVTARALSKGKVMFSGPADTLWTKQIIDRMADYNVDTTIIDGAISRVSHGSPAITDSMILTTGAAVSANIPKLVSHTKYVIEMIGLEEFCEVTSRSEEIPGFPMSHLSDLSTKTNLLSTASGIYAISPDGTIHNLHIPSVFLLKDHEHELFKHGNTLYVAGAVSDRVLDFIRMQKAFRNTTLIVRDFTRLFVKPETYKAFINSGHKLQVLLRTKLIAVCVNPVSPEGYVLNSAELCAGLSQAINLPVYDIKKQ